MRYTTEPEFKKYVKGYGFLSSARRFSDKYGKKLMNTTTKTGIDAAKTASKRVVQKTAEATGDLNGNKIADKITSIGKSKEKKKKKTQKKSTFPQKKDNKLLMICNYFKKNVTLLYKKWNFKKL